MGENRFLITTQTHAQGTENTGVDKGVNKGSQPVHVTHIRTVIKQVCFCLCMHREGTPRMGLSRGDRK